MKSNNYFFSDFLPDKLSRPTLNIFLIKGSDWIRLVFAHPSPLNSGAPIASANLISDGKVQVSPYHTHS